LAGESTASESSEHRRLGRLSAEFVSVLTLRAVWRYRMHRKDFLKRAGVGSAALASLPLLANAAAAQDEVEGVTNYDFVALSGTGATLTESENAIAMRGCGRFGPGETVAGGGHFVHFDGRNIPSPDFIATGRWKANHFVSWQEVGTWGVGVSGILVMLVSLLPCDAEPIRGATLRIVCNIGPAGILTGEIEGYVLEVPGGPTFRQFSPNIGLTLFNRNCRALEPHE
jgi:hypothetical protein